MKTEPHIGHNIRIIREIKGLKQDALASLLGETQQMISRMEKSQKVEDQKINKVAQVLQVDVQLIKSFSEDFLLISDSNKNAYEESLTSISKITELYERLLKAEREMNKLSEQNSHLLSLLKDIRNI